jgi:hypothetical protein
MKSISLRQTEFPESASAPGSEPSSEQVFVRSPSVVSRRVAGETLIVPVRGKVGDLASIYSFNGTGSLLWDLLQTPTGLRELIGAVEQEFEVAQAQAQAQRDVRQFLDDMLSVGLVEVRSGVARVRTEMTAAEMTVTTPQVQEELQAGS